MKKRNFRLALWAALLCVALLCGTIAAAAEEVILDLDVEAAGVETVTSNGDDLSLELDPGIDSLMEDDPVAALDDMLLDLDGGSTQEAPKATEDNAVIIANDESSESDADKVPLRVIYFGPALIKDYDCTRNIFKKTENGGYAYLITPPKAEDFMVEPAKGSAWVEGHKDVRIKVTSIKKSELFPSRDAGSYELNFTFGLEGDDADYYAAQSVAIPATIIPLEVVITPRTGLSKVYGSDDPVYPNGSWLSNDETSPLHQDVSGVPGYGIPVNNVDGKTTLTITNGGYLLAEAKLNGTKFFPNDGWLSRKAGEKVGRYRITIGDMDFGPNFKMTLLEDYFTITARSVTDEKVAIASISNRTYTGEAITPNPILKFNGKRLKVGRDYKVTYANNKKVGKAKVTITGMGNFTGRQVIYFTIVPKKTAISKLTAGKGQITVNWQKGSGITGYQVAYSLKSDFSTQTKKNVKGVSKKSLVIKNLESQKTYYVRIRTYKTVDGKNYYSSWSKAKKVTTK